MKLPKLALAQTAPDQSWGVVRLRSPVILAEFACINPHAGVFGVYQPYVWPPDVKALTTEQKFHESLTRMWYFFADETGDADEVSMYEIDLARPLPRYLVLDNDSSDFTGVLDTQDGVLWRVSGDCAELDAEMGWQMHPSVFPQVEFPRSTREVLAFWQQFMRRQNELEKDT